MTDADVVRKNVRTLLNRVGDYRRCPVCQTEVWWVTHKNRKKAPYTVEARVHLEDCTMRADTETATAKPAVAGRT